jgi:hypothetical protein
MPLLNDKIAPFMNELGSRRVIEAQQQGIKLSHEERERL